MHIQNHDIHVWSAPLTITADEEKIKFALLSRDERERALQFHFPIHKRRFIAARSALREILSHYLNIAPEKISFTYGEHKKPCLHDASHSRLQFNLAHSSELAVYAFTLEHAIGIDVEKIEADDKQAIAQRFFSSKENQQLMHLSAQEKIAGFYRIWARKEALIKAVGKGLSIPLDSFSVSADDMAETIHLENERWSLLSLPIHPDYQAALASNQPINKIQYWDFRV